MGDAAATGEIERVTTDDRKNAAAVALGRMGGNPRAAGMSAKRRRQIAKKAAKARWSELRRFHQGRATTKRGPPSD